MTLVTVQVPVPRHAAMDTNLDLAQLKTSESKWKTYRALRRKPVNTNAEQAPTLLVCHLKGLLNCLKRLFFIFPEYFYLNGGPHRGAQK